MNTDAHEQVLLQEVQNETETNKSDKDTRVFHNPVYDTASEIAMTSTNDNMTSSEQVEARELTTEDNYDVAYPPPASNQALVKEEGASAYELQPEKEGKEGAYDITVHGRQARSPQSHDQDKSHDKDNYSSIPNDYDYDYADIGEPQDASKEATTAKPQGGDYEDASILMLTTPPAAGTT